MGSDRLRLVAIWFIVLGVVGVELVVVLHAPNQNSSNLRHLNNLNTTEVDDELCSFDWTKMQCSPSCCIQTHSRKGVPPSLCEPCHDHSFSYVVRYMSPPINLSLSSIKFTSTRKATFTTKPTHGTVDPQNATDVVDERYV